MGGEDTFCLKLSQDQESAPEKKVVKILSSESHILTDNHGDS